MKKFISLFLVFIIAFALCACRGTPRTVVITESNFYEYFRITESIELPIYNSYSTGRLFSGKAVITIKPLFDGKWSELNYDIIWELVGSAPEYTTSFYLMDNMKGKDVTPIIMKTSFDNTYISGMSTEIHILRLENVSGTITVYD